MSEEKNAFCGTLSEASVIQKDADRSNIVYLSFQEGIKGKITFLEESIFRYDVSTDGAFPEYAAPRDEAHTAGGRLHKAGGRDSGRHVICHSTVRQNKDCVR